MIPFKEQTHSQEFLAIVISEYLKFVNTPREIDIQPMYRNGKWNVMRYTEELHEHLGLNNIKHRLVKTEEPI